MHPPDTAMIAVGAIWICSIITLLLGLILHFLGIYSIIRSRKKTSPNIILLNVSLVEILVLLYGVPTTIHQYTTFNVTFYQNDTKMRWFLTDNLSPKYSGVSAGFYCLYAFQIIFVMTILTTDRLVCAINPLRYATRMTSSIAIKILLSSWILSVILGVAYGMYPNTRLIFYYIGMCLGGSYILFAIITYSVIYIRIRASKRKFARKSKSQDISEGSTDESASWKFYVVSGLIVASFTFLYVIPIFIRAIMIRHNYTSPLTRTRFLVHEGLLILIAIGLMTDVLVYVFLKKEFKKLVCALVHCNARSGIHRNVSSYRNQSMTIESTA